MAKTIRYCISCGIEIGDAFSCTNSECAGLPNFYRNVPGPDSHRSPEDYRPPRGSIPRDAPPSLTTAGLSSLGAIRPSVVGAAPRRTVALSALPVALLRRTSSPPDEHLIAPGVTDVGAKAPAQILLALPEISTRHARIHCAAGGGGSYSFEVEDVGSTNGTFVNGKRIQREPLKAGDRIRFARIEFELRVLADDAERRTLQV